MIAFPKPYADAVARLRVPSGFLLVLVFAWFSRPTTESLLRGLPVALAGLALRGWAAGCLAKNQRLASGGPYAHTRNPLYIGTLLVAAGLAVAARSGWLALLFGAVFLLVYLPVIQLEEQHLREIFPEYEEYAKVVPALWPRIGPAISGRDPQSGSPVPPTPFQWVLYRKNQEYQAAIGLATGLVFLLWKALG